MARTLTTAEVSAARRDRLSRAYMTYFAKDPLHLVRGSGAYVYDVTGRRYLDATASIVTISVGHCNPAVQQAKHGQLELADHFTTLHLEDRLAQAAERLIDVTPDGLDRAFFVNSGTEANELAAVAARLATGKNALLSLMHSFHARTAVSAGLTAQRKWRNRLPGQPDVFHVPNPYAFRRPNGVSEHDFFAMCLHMTREVMLHSAGGRVAALWIEPIQGNGGVIAGPPWYYDELVQMVHEFGGLVVADEVQTGVGRTGRWWGCEAWNRKPDIITMAKGLGNGHPVGAVVMTDQVDRAFEGQIHFNTHGGNPVSMAVATEVLNQVESMMPNIRQRGVEIRRGLDILQAAHPALGDIRGEGLMQGIEIIDPRTQAAAPETTALIQQHCREAGILIGTGGVAGNILRIKPPFCITAADVESLLGALDSALSAVEAKTA